MIRQQRKEAGTRVEVQTVLRFLLAMGHDIRKATVQTALLNFLIDLEQGPFYLFFT
jgi:hypothetical protein